jgi:hypothetical protein
LDVALDSTHTDPLTDALTFVQGIAAGIDKVVKRPAAERISQAAVNGFVTNKRVFVGWHNRVFLVSSAQNYKTFTQSICVVEENCIFLGLF